MAEEVQKAPDAPENPDDKPCLFQKLINVLLFVMILIHPTQATVKFALEWLAQYAPQAEALASRAPSLHFTLADGIILLIIPIWCVKCLFSGGLRHLKVIPLPVWLLAVMGLISLCPFLKPDVCQLEFPTDAPESGLTTAMLLKRAVLFGKEWIQQVLYLMVAFLFIASSVQWRRTLTALAYTFLVVITAVVGYGGLEYWATHDIHLPAPKVGAASADAAEAARPGVPASKAAPTKPQTKPAPASAAKTAPQPGGGQSNAAPDAGASASTGKAAAEQQATVAKRSLEDLLTIKAIKYPMDVDSTFGFDMIPSGPSKIGTKSNRNVLGAFLALTLPLAFGLALFHPNFLVKLWMMLVVLAGLSIVLSGGAFIAIGVGLVLVGAMRGSKTAGATLLLLGLMLLVVYPRLPRQNQKVILDSLMLKKTTDLYGSLPAPMTGKDIPEESQWQQKYREWQAALNAISLNPLVGVGLGYYQQNINAYYDMDLDEEEDYYTVPKEAGVNYMEPDSNNYYLVTAVEMGIPGLLLVCWMIAHFSRLSGAAYVTKAHPLRRALAAGLCGSMAGFAVGSLFTVMLVRGLAITVVLILGFIHGVSYRPASSPPDAA